jgi:hypothetical protein
LSELFPDPAGTDADQEFVELENAGDADADLAGWRLANASGKTYALSGTVGAHGFFAVTYAESKIALVNTGMTLTLLDPSGNPVDAVSYGAAKEGKAYARDGSGAWQWTSTPTPGAGNQFDPEQTPKEPAPPETPPLVLPTDPIATEPAPAPPPPAAAPEPPPAPVSDAARSVMIAAFMPDPVGDDAAEWVRLANAGNADARMDGWSLDDDEGGSRPFPLAGVTVPANGSVTLQRSLTKIALNNDADAVRLLALDGTPAQRVAYTQPPEGKWYEFVNGAWRWLPEDVPSAAAPAMAASMGAATGGDAPPGPDDDAEPADIGELGAASGDAFLSLEGTVTLPPGVLGKRTFAFQQRDGSAGVFVRVYGRDAIAPLAAGDAVTMTGRVKRDGAALSFMTLGRNLRKTASGKLSYAERTIEELDEEDEGVAIAVTGIVAHRGKTSLVLADDAQRSEVVVRTKGVSMHAAAAAGAKVAVRGIARVRDGKVELIVAEKDAVKVAAPPVQDEEKKDAPKPAAAEPPAVAARPPLVFAYAEKKRTAAYAGAAIAFAVAASVGLLIVRRKRLESVE